jgi:predicted FMN-binding regulatory protein PaiB
MHTFAEYAPCRDAQVAELVRHNPFAAVISTDHGVPVATHVPVITPPSQQLRAGGALPQILPAGQATMRVLTETVRAVEALREDPWDMSASLARFHHIAGGVVAFSLRVTAVQAVFKLSQDTPDRLWQRVHDGLGADPVSVQVARDMAAAWPGRAT